MGIWVEQHFGRSLTETGQGLGIARLWHVVGSTPQVARGEPEAPHYLDVHPDNTGLVVSSVAFDAAGFGAIVRASYTPVEFLPPVPPEDTTNIDWIKIDVSSKTQTVDLPLFQIVKKNFPIVGGGVEEKLIFRPIDRVKSYEYTNAVYRVTVNAIVTGGSNFDSIVAATSVIEEQVNKIHVIAGKDYLFASEGSRRIEEDMYQFVYKWTSDKGVPNTFEFDLFSGPNLGVLGSVVYPHANNEYIIPPFKMLDTSPAADDPTLPPLVFISDRYVRDDNGYTTLPGIG